MAEQMEKDRDERERLKALEDNREYYEREDEFAFEQVKLR